MATTLAVTSRAQVTACAGVATDNTSPVAARAPNAQRAFEDLQFDLQGKLRLFHFFKLVGLHFIS